MAQIGIIICNRERTCSGGKCFMSIQQRAGAFKKYSKNEPLEIVGFITCGGCPGERLEKAAAEMKKYGVEEIYLASCFLAGYPPCPYIGDFIQYIENYVKLPVVVGTHPMPTNYINAHNEAKDWERSGVRKYLEMITDDPEASLRYDSTRPEFGSVKLMKGKS